MGFSRPGCPELRSTLAETARKVISTQWNRKDVRVTQGGTYVNMEGPAFSTIAESNAYRQFGFDIIGMTSLAEAKLCREAELCYQSIALVTDYDCWRVSEEAVTIDMVIAVLKANTALAQLIVKHVASVLPLERRCDCGRAMEHAIITDSALVPAETKKRPKPIIGKYVK